ncbi:AMP-binding protein [Actinomadura geliboluensis]|uniref:non-ribosomal peptide synthetase n=1 Tax=Actinomadura geliboluensis TaxID=882440 RepID=UPI00371C1240
MRSFDASAAHKGLWLAQKMMPDTLNHALSMWEVDGELDVAVMESAFLRVMDEAEVLRVNFVDNGDGDLRIVPRGLGEWRPFFLDVGGEDDPDRAAREALSGMLAQPFDLERDLLFRLGVVRLAEARFLVVLAYHHLISDGYGVGGLLSRRLAEVYTALARGAEVSEPPHPWDAESYAAEASEYLASQRFTDDMEFWRDYLKDAPPPAQVPRLAVPDPDPDAEPGPVSPADRWSELAGALGMVSRTVAVPRAEADAWGEAAESMGVWTSSLLTAGAAVFLRHRCDHPEFLLSVAMGNRTGAAGRTPGLAVNVVPIRVRVPLTATFAEIAEAVLDETYEVFGRAACHYSDIQRASGTVLSGRGGFGAVMNVVDFTGELRFGGSPARYTGGTNGVFDELSISVCTDGTDGSDLYFRLDAPAGLYTAAELRLIGADLVAYVRAAAADPKLPVGALDVVSGADRDRVPAAPNDTDVPLPGLTVPELFARQAARTPDAAAVVSGDGDLSYRELDERSSRLAGALHHRGVGPETVVAVAMPRSADLVVALLGVAKAGGAYLPVDPASPAEHIASVLGGSAQALLTSEAPPADLDVPTILFGDLDSDTAGGGQAVRPDNLLAVTHGSTGAAEVALTHRNLERFAMDRRWRDGDAGTVLWHAPHTFDAFALEVWAPLLNGGRVVVAPPGELDLDALAAVRAAHEISVMWSPAELLASIAAERPDALAGMREAWTCGDRVSAAAMRRVRDACPELAIVHGHGPGETGGFVACHRLPAGEPSLGMTLIGRPMDNTALYVLGPGLAPVPAGVAGELYAAGPGVARGLHGRPGTTAERFVPCPFGPPGAVMHRTGDRVRWGADGRLEHLGRAGARARIRGVPVEPAEVEAVLADYPGLARAAVAVREDGSGQRRLVAYAVPLAPQAGLSEEELRRFAAGRLPEPLMPSAFLVVDRLPATAGGWVDRASLPEPASGEGKYRAPRNAVEEALARAFAEALGLERVGVDDDFFDLGGNSLRAIRLAALIRDELNQEVSIRTLFVARTVTGLSGMWQDLARSSRPALRRRTKDGELL